MDLSRLASFRPAPLAVLDWAMALLPWSSPFGPGRPPSTFAGYVPGFSGAHSQGATLDELNKNLREVVAMLLEDGSPELDA